jgi:hypothetical protein
VKKRVVMPDGSVVEYVPDDELVSVADVARASAPREPPRPKVGARVALRSLPGVWLVRQILPVNTRMKMYRVSLVFFPFVQLTVDQWEVIT